MTRTRRTLMFAFILVLAVMPIALAPMLAAAGEAVLAQQEQLDPDAEGEPGDPVGDQEGSQAGEEAQGEGGEGQEDPDAQTGAGEDEAEGAAEVEEGPVWTYQMARMGLGLLVLLLLGIAFTYWRLVSHRQKHGAA